MHSQILLERSMMSLMDTLRSYSSDKSKFITFTDIIKLGINPKSDWDDPIGIYTYPIKEMIENIENKLIPFAGDRKFVFILEPTSNYVELQQYTNSDLDRDLDILISKFHSAFYTASENITDGQLHFEANLMHWYERWSHSPGVALWRIIERLSNYVANRFPNRSVNVISNQMFRTLGYGGVVDRGESIISNHEPSQAVFFDIKSCKVVEMFNNNLLRPERMS